MIFLKCASKWGQRGSYFKLSTNRYTSRFLLVSLNIDVILQETTIHRRRQKLNAMADGLGLGDAYSATLGWIKEQSSERSIKIVKGIWAVVPREVHKEMKRVHQSKICYSC